MHTNHAVHGWMQNNARNSMVLELHFKHEVRGSFHANSVAHWAVTDHSLLMFPCCNTTRLNKFRPSMESCSGPRAITLPVYTQHYCSFIFAFVLSYMQIMMSCPRMYSTSIGKCIQWFSRYSKFSKHSGKRTTGCRQLWSGTCKIRCTRCSCCNKATPNQLLVSHPIQFRPHVKLVS